MRFHLCAPMALVLLFTLTWNQSAGQEKPVLTDLYGDPLPKGAIARLGTSRLQHGGKVCTLAYAADGKQLASAGADKMIRIWDAQTGKALQTLEGHKGTVHCVAFVPTIARQPEQILVSASSDKTIRFWNLKTGKELDHIIKHLGSVTALAISPDGKLLASGGNTTAEIFLWQVADGKEVRRWKAHHGGVTGLVFAPDGKTLASGGLARKQSFLIKAAGPEDDYAVAVWETATGRVKHTLTGHNSIAWAIAFSANGKLLASSGMDKNYNRSVILWDPATGKQQRVLKTEFGGGTFDVQCLALTKNSKILAGGNVNCIHFWETSTGAEQASLSGAITDPLQALAFSSDGLFLASAGCEGRITLWDAPKRTAKNAGQGHMEPLTSVAVSPNGKTIATSSYDGTAWLWDRPTSKPLRQLNHLKVPGGIVTWCATFSPDGRTVALAHQRDGITFWDVPSGKLQREIEEKHFDRIVSVAFSPDGKLLASESTDQPYASVWNVSTGALTRTLAHGQNNFAIDRGFSSVISPDGRFLASAASNDLYLWNLDSGNLAFQKTEARGRAIAFSPGGLLLASMGKGVTLFDAMTGKELAKFGNPINYHAFGSRGIAFSPDGRLLAFPAGNRVKIWGVLEGRELASFDGHLGKVVGIAFTPDSKAVVSAAEDCTALVWNVAGLLPAEKPSGANVLWEELGSSDRLKAYASFCKLRAAPDNALPILKKHLQFTQVVPAEHLAMLIKNLDSQVFKTREEAFKELKHLGPAAEKALLQAYKNPSSLEAKLRLEKLLKNRDANLEWQPTLLALQLLEAFNSPPAREILQSLAKGDPSSRLTQAAGSALKRLHKDGGNP